MTLHDDGYVTDEAAGQSWELLLGDSCERLAQVADESVDLSVYSPPFSTIYVYSPSPRDIGNSRDAAEYLTHLSYVIRETYRVTKPGRLSCVHIFDVPLTKTTHGRMGLQDIPGDIIRAHEAEGWIYYGRWTIDKNPQTQAKRTRSHALAFVTLERDSTVSRRALAEYLLIFKKPGDNAVPVKNDVTHEEWIAWARPVWLGIRDTNTLNERVARDDSDERHICPLPLELAERCVRLYSNPGELVLSPFAGIGSEVYTAVRLGRRGIGIELKPSYWRTAVDNLRRAEKELTETDLFQGGDS